MASEPQITSGGSDGFISEFDVSRETAAKLETYVALLRQWQKTINLVAPSTLATAWHRHIADSAQLVDRSPTGPKHWLDLGTGAGFPGLVIALMVNAAGSPRAGSKVTLVESDVRKCAFLREVARNTGAVVDIVAARIESPATQSRVGSVDIVTSRALAPLRDLISYARPFAGPDTLGLFLKGRDAERELSEARLGQSFEADLVPSCTDPAGRIVIVRGFHDQAS